MRPRERGMAGLLIGTLLGAVVWMGPAGAQNANQNPAAEDALLPPPRPVAIYLADTPVVTAVFNGEFGATRVTGTLESAPSEPLHLTDVTGHSRDVAWSDVRDLALVRSASEGLPLGSFTVNLLTDPQTPATGPDYTGGYLSPALSSPGVGQVGWRLLSLPEGQVTLRGQNYGQITIPVSSLVSLDQQPLRGSVVQLPAGMVRVEVLARKTVDIPLPDVVSLRRDLKAGTVSVTLADGQLFTGKLIQLPDVNIPLEGGRDRRPVPLSRVLDLEFTAPLLGGASSTPLGSGTGTGNP